MNIVVRKGLSSNVSIAGGKSQSQVVQYLHRSKVFVFFSISEAMPVSLMESLACEVPVVASNVRGILSLLSMG